MKIDCHQIVRSLMQRDSTSRTPVNDTQSTQTPTDDVSLENREHIRSLLKDRTSDPGVATQRLCACAVEMVNGVYEVPAEEVADAILAEADLLGEVLK